VSEDITLDLTDSQSVVLDLGGEDVFLDLGTAPPIVLDVVEGVEAVTLDFDTTSQEVTLDVTTEEVTIAFTDASVSLDLATTTPGIVLEVGPDVGPMGPAGPPGIQGPPGPPGVGSSFVWNQASPDVLWIIPHTVPYRPAVTIVDSAGTELFADVSYISDTLIHITHEWPTAGYAYLT
jgi:hypothetical protein